MNRFSTSEPPWMAVWPTACDRHLAYRTFVAGDHLTMADLPLLAEVHRWLNLPQPRPALAHLDRWYAALIARPSIRGVLDVPLT